MNDFAKYWAENFNELKINLLDKRWVVLDDLMKVFPQLPDMVELNVIGHSFLNAPIHRLTIGTGAKNVIAWSCMHGNESTSLRGWMDLFVNQDNNTVKAHFAGILKEYTLHFIPLLNPDGAMLFTRRNAMGLDMNRDARALQTPEMRILLGQIEDLKPVIAFNLHDQRNIFAVNNKPASISFLAPSTDVNRSVDACRALTMDLIGHAHNTIKEYVNGDIGRYTDEYYPTAIGERVQEFGIPTILVECGASLNDTKRQNPRMLNAIILHAVLNRHAQQAVADTLVYNNIPLNKTNLVDILIKNVLVKSGNQTFKADIALLEEMFVENGALDAVLKINDFGDLNHLVGLNEYLAEGDEETAILKVGAKAHFEIKTKSGNLIFIEGKQV